MVTITLNIPETLLASILQEAIESESTLDEYVLESLTASLGTPLPTKSVVNIEHLIEKALAAANAMPKNHLFTLLDLCSSEDWEALSAGDRKSIGKLFRKAAKAQIPNTIEFNGRNSSNKALYVRF